MKKILFSSALIIGLAATSSSAQDSNYPAMGSNMTMGGGYNAQNHYGMMGGYSRPGTGQVDEDRRTRPAVPGGFGQMWPGNMGSYGSPMGGYGMMGPGMMSGYGPMGPGVMRGYGSPMSGYGPMGPGMMGGYGMMGPGMMGGYGMMGPGMMGGHGHMGHHMMGGPGMMGSPGMMGGYGPMGPGMMGGYGSPMGGYGMMGPGMMGGFGGPMGGYGHMGPGMMGGHGMMGGYGNDDYWSGGYGSNSEQYQKFLDETVDLRKQIIDKRFEYIETLRRPDTSSRDLSAIVKEISDLRSKLYEKMNSYK